MGTRSVTTVLSPVSAAFHRIVQPVVFARVLGGCFEADRGPCGVMTLALNRVAIVCAVERCLRASFLSMEGSIT